MQRDLLPYSDLVRRLASASPDELRVIERVLRALELQREERHEAARREMLGADDLAIPIEPLPTRIPLDEIDDAFDTSDADEPTGPFVVEYDFEGGGGGG